MKAAKAAKPPAQKPKALGESKAVGDTCLEGLYTVLESVGKGSFGDIWLVKHTRTAGETCCLKEIALKGLSAGETKAAKLEVDVLRRISHPHVVQFISAFEAPQAVAILMEHAKGGDLGLLIEQRIRDGGDRFSASQIATYASQIGACLAYLHNDIQLLHRDIKPSNVFLRPSGDACLGDFGMCELMPCRRINLIPAVASTSSSAPPATRPKTPSKARPKKLQMLPPADASLLKSRFGVPPSPASSARPSVRGSAASVAAAREAAFAAAGASVGVGVGVGSSNAAAKLGGAAAKRAKKSQRARASNPYDDAVGTPVYMSPEHINGAPFDRDADVWAFACTLYEAMGLAPPWAELDDGYGGMEGGMPALLKLLTTSSLDVAHIRGHYPPTLCSLLSALLHRELGRRVSLDDFLRQLSDVRPSILRYEATASGGAPSGELSYDPNAPAPRLDVGLYDPSAIAPRLDAGLLLDGPAASAPAAVTDAA